MRSDKIYRKVTDYLKAAIASGEMKLGDAIYSENKLCEILAVSRTSVRRAIREMVEDNILESRHGVGTFIKGLSPSSTICLVNHYTRVLRYSTVDSYYTDFIYSAEQEATAQNIRFQIFSGVVRNEAEIRSRMSHLNADGLILDGNFQDHFEHVEDFYTSYKHLVILDGNPEQSDLPSVSPDLEAGFAELLPLAIKRGDNLLFLYNSSLARRRWAFCCFKKAAAKAGISADYCDYTENISSDLINGIDHNYLMKNALDRVIGKKKYGAIICDSDRSALNVIEILKNRGYRVPEDIAVSGVGATGFSGLTSPATTTIKVDTASMGRAAVNLLSGLIRGSEKPQRILLPVQMLRRESL